MANPRTDDFIPTDEAAAIAGKTGSCLRMWRKAGIGPRFYKAGKLCFYRRSEVETYAKKKAKRK